MSQKYDYLVKRILKLEEWKEKITKGFFEQVKTGLEELYERYGYLEEDLKEMMEMMEKLDEWRKEAEKELNVIKVELETIETFLSELLQEEDEG